MFASYEAPKYGDYEYPAVAEVMGWVFGFSPLVPAIFVAVKTITESPGATFKEVLLYYS